MQMAINYYAGKVENVRDNYKVQLQFFFFQLQRKLHGTRTHANNLYLHVEITVFFPYSKNYTRMKIN